MKTSPRLEDLLDFLANPLSYPVPPEAVDIIQTHISVVALAGDFAYKLKKSIDLGFLDFSSLAQRKFYCEEEIRLNQRLSQGVYLAVLPIYWNDQHLSFQHLPASQVVDYVVKMRRLTEESFLVNLIQKPDFEAFRLNHLTKKLKDFYQKNLYTVKSQAIDDLMGQNVAENFTQMRDSVHKTIPSWVYHILQKYQTDFLTHNAYRFAQRHQQGKIIEGHGDLRSEHIHLLDNQANIYDCIEFSERLRYLDWLNDVAFLTMDLAYRKRYDLVKYLKINLIDSIESEPVDDLLNFYESYRACVRGKVDSFKALEAEIPPEIRAFNSQKAQEYFYLALRYAVLGRNPTLIIVLGGVATGKTTVAANVAKYLNIKHFNSDTLRKQIHNLPLYHRLPDIARGQLYTPQANQMVYEELNRQALQTLDKEGFAVVDATFRNQVFLQNLIDICEKKQIQVLLIQTLASEQTVVARLQQREYEQVVSDMRLSDYQAQEFTLQYAAREMTKNYFEINTEGDLVGSLENLFLEIQEKISDKSKNNRKATIFA
ncbi:MAG: AAA family ATPase [Microscillaceae bacterium]|jgi:hypothetical protein|nr:AAA family ATPase [Microscillaceae bacterium]